MTYRRRFLKGKAGVQICKYCGAIRTKKYITVDHIIPQNIFRKMTRLVVFINIILFMFVFGFSKIAELYPASSNILSVLTGFVTEDIKVKMIKAMAISIVFTLLANKFKHCKLNMVSSCKKCNSKKSDKINFQVLQGFMAMIIFSKPMLITIVVFAIYYFQVSA